MAICQKTKISLGEAIRVPIYYNKQTFTRVGKNKSAIDLYNLSYLMMYKDKNNQMHTEWVITMPDDDFVDKKPLSNPRFSGLIYILDWKGSLIKAYKITPDGHQYISNDISFSEGDKQLMVSDTRKTDYVYQECTQTAFAQSCSDGCTGGYEIVYVESCYWVSIDDGGGGSSGGGITPTDPITGGGGSTTPGDYTPTNPNCPEAPVGNSTGNIKVDMVSPDDPCASNTTIINNIKDPCLRSMVQYSIDNNIKINLTESINAIFNINDDFNLYYEEDNTLPDSIDGTTHVIYDNSSGGPSSRVLGIQIDLNSNTLPNASKEYITATILHEALHAYFFYSGTIIDHNNMAYNYLDWFKNSIKSIYPNISDYDAEALGWGGLSETWVWQNTMTNNVKTEIALINERYKNGTNGTKCN